MTKEILNDRAVSLLKTFNFYDDFDTFDKFSIIQQAKRVFDGGYEEEVIKTKMYKKKIEKLQKRWLIMDQLIVLQRQEKKIKEIQAIRQKLKN